MREITNFFQDRKVNFDKLRAFGFIKKGNLYQYHHSIYDLQFDLLITVFSNGTVFTQLNDTATGDEYILHLLSDTTGAFVGQIRQEYEAVLSAINDACFENNIFKEKQTLEVIQYITEKYQDELEFLWKKFPQNAIFRRKDNQKWYAAFLVIKPEKIGLSGETEIEILDIRANSDDIASLVDGKKYFQGFHMNKQHWLTICLDGSVPLSEVLKRVDTSYILAKK